MTEHEEAADRREQAHRLPDPRCLEEVPDWVWEVDSEGRFRYSNRVVEDALGIAPSTLLGMSIFDLLAPDDQQKCRTLFDLAVRSKQPVRNVITHFVTRGGDARVFELSCVPMLNGHDRLIGLRGITRDITDHLVLERTALEALANYKSALDDAPTGVVIIQNERIVYANPKMLQIMQYAADQAVGSDPWRFIHPEDRERVRGYYLKRMAGEESPEEYELRTLSSTGEVRHFELRVTLIHYRGAPAVLDNIVDVTDRKRAEQALAESERRYRALVEQTSDWVWEVDENSIYTYVSPRVRDLLGYEPEEVLGKTPFELMPPDEAERMRTALAYAAAERKPIALLENTMLHKNGDLVVVETSGEPILDQQGDLRGYRGIDRDVTQRRKEMQRLTLLSDCFLNFGPNIIDNINCLTRIVGELMDADCALYNRLDEGMLCSWGAWHTPADHPRADRPEGHICYDMMKRGENRVHVLRGLQESEYAQTDPSVSAYGLRTYVGRTVQFANCAVGSLCCLYKRDFSPDDADERLIDIVASAIAVEERRHCAEQELRDSEAKFRDLVENINDWVWRIGTNLVFEYSSPGVRDILGYEPGEMIGKTPTDFMAPEEAQRVMPQLRQLVERPGAFSLMDVVLLHKDGHSVVLRSNGTPVYDRHGEFSGIRGISTDVTALVEAEERLHRRSSELEAVLAAFPDLYFWLNDQWVITGYHVPHRSVLFVPPEEFVDRRMQDVLPPDVGDRIAGALEESRRTGAVTAVEYTLPIEGAERSYEARFSPLEDGGTVASIRDITERMRTARQLAEAEAKYRGLVEESLVGVYIIRGSRFAYVNPRFAEMLGYSPDELLALDNVLRTVAPEDRDLVTGNLRKRLSGEVQSLHYSFKALRRDGTPIDIEVHGTRTTYEGQPAVIGSALDITERKRWESELRESEERYRRLFERSPDVVFVLKGQHFIGANPAVRRVLGYEPTEIVGLTPWDLSPEVQPDGASSQEKARSIIAGVRGAEPVAFEWVHRRKDGTLADCDVSLTAYRVRGETLIQAIVRDITDRKRAEEHRRALEKQLEAQKRQFYRDTILSVTGGKLDICDTAEVRPYISTAQLRIRVRRPEDVADARRQVEEYLREKGLDGDELSAFMIGVGEAIANAVKHASGGRVYAGRRDGSVWAGVADRGDGINSLILPRATLLRGFSTKPSLGLGYTIMLEVSDRILLRTGEKGTTVLLVRNLAEPETPQLSAGMLPDTWEGVSG